LQCVVPKLAGKRLSAARRTLARAHCRLGRVALAYSTRFRRDHVMSQRPRAGRRLRGGAEVSVVVSRGRRR
jgi:beta-lactam-binding protein with PASTA domain